MEVKQKTAVQFKFFEGSMNFAVLCSIIDTVIKNGQGEFNSLIVLVGLEVTD